MADMQQCKASYQELNKRFYDGSQEPEASLQLAKEANECGHTGIAASALKNAEDRFIEKGDFKGAKNVLAELKNTQIVAAKEGHAHADSLPKDIANLETKIRLGTAKMPKP